MYRETAMRKFKKGIALLTTVGLIMILSLLILKSVDISQRYFDKAGETAIFVQLNKTFLDVLAILQSSTKEIKDAAALSVVIGLPIMIGTENDDMNVAIDISSGGSLININNLISNNNTINEPLYTLLQNLLLEYRVANANFFMNILLDAIDTDSDERVYLSEVKLKSDTFTDGGINSKESFRYLMDYFVANGGDAKIYTIPWFDIIGFWGNTVDFNYIKEPLLELIKKEYNLRSLEQSGTIGSYDELQLSSGDKDKLKALNIVFFAPRVLCRMNFFYLKQAKSLEFLYDIESKKVGYIEAIF
jgi:hypothetical protein